MLAARALCRELGLDSTFDRLHGVIAASAALGDRAICRRSDDRVEAHILPKRQSVMGGERP
jgi:hypothetical protein